MFGKRAARGTLLGRLTTLLSLLGVVFAAWTPSAQAVGNYNNAGIADYALTKVGQHGDQCRVFVNNVIAHVSGGTQHTNTGGGSYFTPFTNAGGVEITDYNQLSKGDVVQKYVSSTDLHTWIIVSRDNDGKYWVVDSNSQNDNEIVRHYKRTQFTGLSSTTRAFRMGTISNGGNGSGLRDTFDSFDWRHMSYTGTDTLTSGQALLPGQYMMSPNGQWALALYGGKLGLFSGQGGPRMELGNWVSNSALVMQNDGNLVLYGPNSSVLWSSGTGGNSGSRMALQNDGNLVVYSWQGIAIWASNTGGSFPANSTGASSLTNGQSLSKCSTLTSADGRFRLVLTCGGELLLYGPGYSVMWRTTTSASDSALSLQNDGNLVLYGPNSSVLWSSGTGGNSGDNLAVQNDGNVVIYSWSGIPIWATNT